LQDNNGNTALHVAVSNGHLNVTRVLVEKGANLCAADASDSTALHIAAESGYLNIVQYLADSFAPIDMRNARKETALLVAAAEGHEKRVRFLIKQGAGSGVRNITGKTALDIATVKGHTAIIQVLNDRAEGNELIFSILRTGLNTDSEISNVEHLHLMNSGLCAGTERGRNGNYAARMLKTTAEGTVEVRSDPRSALHTAAVNSNLEEVQRLVEAGTALDYCDKFGRTALWTAAERGHKLIIRFLL
jgi:ankyrin repeat protein